MACRARKSLGKWTTLSPAGNAPWALLASALGTRALYCSQTWQLLPMARRDDRFERGPWIFRTAYHIKVAVRDHSTFWLSSGNWNNSNQPEQVQLRGQYLAQEVVAAPDT